MVKYFIIKIAVFLGVFFLILEIINFGYERVMLSNTVLQRTEEQMLEARDEVKILFLGDSHPKYSINPEYISESFNYSSSGENYFQSYLKFRRVIEEGSMKLEKIVIPIDFHSFSSYGAKRFLNEWYWKNFDGFTEWHEFSGVKNSLRRLALSNYPVVDNGGEFVSYLLKKPNIAELKNGWQNSSGDYSKSKTKEKKIKKRLEEQYSDDILVNEYLYDYFIKIVEMAEAEGIEVALLKYPISKNYYHALDSIFKDKEGFYHRIETDTSKYQKVRILDYQREYFENDNYFFNPDHLNNIGAKDFSIKLNNELSK